MRRNTSLEGVTVFVAVAQSLSFTAAAKQLSVSPSAVSQAIRNLEERLGTLLLRRTTRSISLTEAGSDYLAAIAPALAQVERATQNIAGRSVEPSGLLRLIMPRAAFDWRIAPLLKKFQIAYPDIVLELDVEGRLIDIVQQGFDAGVRYGPLLEPDMIAAKIGGSSESVVVAAPEYFAARTKPSQPADLTKHVAVVCRREMTERIPPWKLERDQESVQLSPPAKVIVQDIASVIDLITRGIGVGCVPERMVAEQLKTGRLIRVLPAWSAQLGELFLYYPSQRHKSAALRAFIDFLRAHPDQKASKRSQSRSRSAVAIGN